MTTARPNQAYLQEAVSVYRDAMRPFIVRELKKQRGVKPEEAVRQSLSSAKLDLFDRNLRASGLESAIDVNDFPAIVQRNRDAFQSCYDRNPAFMSKLWDVVEGRNAVAHPSNQDLDGEFVRTRISIIVEVLGIIGAAAPQSQVEKIRGRLLALNAPTTTRSKQRSPRGQSPTLPITLDPPNSADFLDALLRTKKAWIEVTYQDGRTEVKPWNAGNMSPTSNVIGNLRSRPEFRNGAWQRNGLASVRAAIERPRAS